MQRMSTRLNERRQDLLKLIVGDYIRTAAPVASQQIARQHDVHVSPATIRHDMAELEEMGFISRPHPSAGSVPQDPAYRFYVERTGGPPMPPRVVQFLIQRSFHTGEADLESWARLGADVLSQAVHNVAIATAPRAFRAHLKHLQMVQLQERQALLVLVMQEARLRQHLISLDRPATQEDLNALAARLNALLAGKTVEEVRAVWRTQQDPDPLLTQVVTELLRLMTLEEQTESRQHYIGGLRHMLGQPEFTAGTRAREAVELLEDDHLIRDLIAESPEHGQVRVIIGEEHRQSRLRPFSVVIAQYGVAGSATGAIGILGPTRMDYGQAISSVTYMANFLNTLLATLHGATN